MPLLGIFTTSDMVTDDWAQDEGEYAYSVLIIFYFLFLFFIFHYFTSMMGHNITRKEGRGKKTKQNWTDLLGAVAADRIRVRPQMQADAATAKNAAVRPPAGRHSSHQEPARR